MPSRRAAGHAVSAPSTTCSGRPISGTASLETRIHARDLQRSPAAARAISAERARRSAGSGPAPARGGPAPSPARPRAIAPERGQRAGPSCGIAWILAKQLIPDGGEVHARLYRRRQTCFAMSGSDRWADRSTGVSRSPGRLASRAARRRRRRSTEKAPALPASGSRRRAHGGVRQQELAQLRLPESRVGLDRAGARAQTGVG